MVFSISRSFALRISSSSRPCALVSLVSAALRSFSSFARACVSSERSEESCHVEDLLRLSRLLRHLPGEPLSALEAEGDF